MSPSHRARSLEVARLLATARRQPHLEREEQLELARRHRHGDLRAGQALVLCNLGLAVHIARQLGGSLRGHEPDLVQEATEGLLRALRLFDPDRGVAFTTYAGWWIRAYVLRYLLQNWRLVRIGTTHAQRQIFFNLSREQRRLEARGERADLSAVARQLGADGNEVAELARHMSTPEGDESLAVALAAPTHERPDAIAEKHELELQLRALISELEREAAPRERTVIRERWRRESPRTLRECGEKLGISAERVRQIEQQLTRKLQVRARPVALQLQPA